MANELILPVEKTSTITEPLGVTLKRLVIEPAATNTAGTVELQLAPLDSSGAWLNGVVPVVLRREDALFETDPQKRFAASMIHELILTAIVADTPTHRALGVVGLTVKEAAKLIVNSSRGGQS